jgi:hypothetical protein
MKRSGVQTALENTLAALRLQSGTEQMRGVVASVLDALV